MENAGVHALGLIGTDFKQLIAKTPLGRFGQPEDLAHIVVFLASHVSGWLTGEILHASGGAR
jgi:3-oxoacyl-[acyl-carrier protein] reductase